MGTQNENRDVEVDLGDHRFTTNGQVFQGKVKVTPEIAEDLKSRLADQDRYQRYLYKDGGKQIEAGTIVGGGA